MSTLKTPKDKRNNAERYKPKKKAGSGRTISDKDKAIMGKGRTISEKDIALIARALGISRGHISPQQIARESKPSGMLKAMSDRYKSKKRPVAKSRMMNKDGSDPLMNKKKKTKPINRINAIVGNRASSKYIQEEAKQKNKQKKMGGGKVHMKKKKK